MSDCERFEERISALLDGELSAEEEAEVRAHMAECAECAAMYEAFAAVGAALKADAEDVPDTLHDGIMTKVRMAEKATKTQHRIVRLRPFLTAAACLIVLVGTVLALKNTVGMRKSEASGNASAPAVAYSASGSTTAAGGAAEASADAIEAPKIMAAKVAEGETGVVESAPEAPMATAEQSNAMLDAAPAESGTEENAEAPQTPAAAKNDATQSGVSARLAGAQRFTIRLEAVSDGELTGVVTDPGDQSLVASEEQVVVELDGAELLSPEIGRELTVFIDRYTTVENGRISSVVMVKSAE